MVIATSPHICVSSQIDSLLSEHYSFGDNLLRRLASEFQDTCYVKLPSFAPPVIETGIKGEVAYMLDRHATRRDVSIKATGNTPRYMYSVSQSAIAEHGQLIPSFYCSTHLLSFLSKIAGEKVVLSPYDGDKFVITKMTSRGDTHGWHWDDYSYSLVWIMESPPSHIGAATEFITDTVWDKSNDKNVEQYISNRKVESRYHKTGDVYFLKANTTMHRVSPLKEDATRIILNMGWANEQDLTKDITHETMEEIYI